MAKPILVANWKNYPHSLAEAKTLVKSLAKQKELYKKVYLSIAPPLTYLGAVAEKASSFAQIASQDLSPRESGTYTGEVLPEILKSFGVRLAIIGHSERRAMGESSVQVAEKVKIALRESITPLVCFGEAVRDHEGEHFETLRQELKASLGGVSSREASKIMLAYEPIWAIGSKSKGAITAKDLEETLIFIKKVLTDLFGRKVAVNMTILYGGSVDAGNAPELLETGVRGFLVGRASLNSISFKKLAQAVLGK